MIDHVINRGNHRQKVFQKGGDFDAFLKALADLKEREPLALYGCGSFDAAIRRPASPASAAATAVTKSLWPSPAADDVSARVAIKSAR